MDFLDVPGGTWPQLGFGTYQLRGQDCERAVEHALALGYRHIDTAAIYENEEAVAQGLRNSGVPRSDVWLTTKVWRDDLRAADIERAVEASLRRLGTDYVDLLLVHWPPEETFLAEVMQTLDTLQYSGKTRHLGISNFTRKLQSEAKTLCPQVLTNQVELHPFFQRTALRQEASEARIVVTAYSPLARGKVMASPELSTIGRRYGKSPAQVTLRWLLQLGLVAIPKALSAVHREENFAIFDFVLTSEEMRTIASLDRGERLVDPPWSPPWDDPLPVAR